MDLRVSKFCRADEMREMSILVSGLSSIDNAEAVNTSGLVVF